jgi:hypothetical protein
MRVAQVFFAASLSAVASIPPFSRVLPTGLFHLHGQLLPPLLL